MSQTGSTVFRVLAAVILVTVLIGGGYMTYQAGQALGYEQGVSASANITTGSAEQNNAPIPFYPGMTRHHFFPFMGFFGFIPLMIGLCLVFGLLRFILWGPRHMHHGPWMYGPYGNHPWHEGHPCGEPGSGHPQGQPDGEKK